MERYMDIFGKLAFVLLAVWVVLAGLGYTTMPGKTKMPPPKKRGKGGIWAVPVVTAQAAEDGLAFPAAPVM